MAKGAASHSEMANARQSDGINVIFDKESPGSSHSRSRSGSDSSHSSGLYRGRGSRRRHYRSSSSLSSSSSSSPHSRSRSHPRCHRRSSRCRCDDHHRYGRDRHSPSRRHRAHSRSSSRSPDRYSSRRRYRFHYRSRSRSPSPWSRERRRVSQHRSRFSPSPPKSCRSRSRSRSSGHSVSLSLHDKRELLQTATSNAMKILGVEKLDLPESVKQILPEQSVESKWVSSEQSVESKWVSSEQSAESKWVTPETRVRQGPQKTTSQNSDAESDDMPSPTTSPKRKIISFSINNSVAKPTLAAPSGAKVTPRVDSYESRKPYGHWVRVKSGQTAKARKHTQTKSH